jgi:nitric oxide reductase NorD protein
LSVFCLTVDREGSAYLPHMFGPRGYTVACDVSDLPARLPEIYRVLTERRA